MKYRIFCFTSAGGGIAHYHRWRRLVETDIEIIPICPPGRESRHQEARLVDFNEIVSDLKRLVPRDLDVPYAILGHSMGSLIAYELGRQLTEEGYAPQLVVAAASRAPHIGPTAPVLHEMSDEELIATLTTRYGDHGEVFTRPEARKIFLPIIRDDLRAIETHKIRSTDPLDCPIIAVGGVDDPSVKDSDLEEWRRYTTAEFRIEFRPGDHFFVHRDHDWLLRTIDDAMTR